MPTYLDTSALIKLVLAEPESEALRGELAQADALVASALLTVEARRAAVRYGALALTRTRAALAAITLLPIDDDTLEAAAALDPPGLRSLDALHLATALSLGDQLERMYCYDRRLAGVALHSGIDVRAPAA